MAFGDKFSRCCKIALLVTGGLQSAANSMDLDLFPLGRVNAEQRQAYVGSSTGIEAIRLDTGETEWTRPPGAQVVCLWKEQVVALLPAGRTAIRVAWLDARTGLVTLRSAPATFPMGVDWSQAQFRCVREGTALLLRWEAMSAYRGGASPKSGMPTKRQSAVGAFRIDAGSGAVEAMPNFEVPAREAQWKCRGRSFALDWNATGVYLKSVSEASRRLVAKSPDAAVQVAADGCSLLIGLPAGGGWRIFPVEGGEGRVVAIEAGARLPAVVGNRIYYLLPVGPADADPKSLLKAVSIDSGKTLWQREVQPFRGGAGRELRQ